MRALVLLAAFAAVGLAQPINQGGAAGAIACVGTPGNTTGAYRQQCQTTGGAIYACNNSSGCAVAADWVSVGSSGTTPVVATFNTATSTCSATGGGNTPSCTASPTSGAGGASGAVITHNLGTSDPWVTCYDGSGNMLGSSTASTSLTATVANSASQVTLTFSAATSGTCYVSTGSMGPPGTGTTPAGSAGGDLGGTYPNPSVVQIQGKAVSSTAPTNGQVLQWNSGASQYQPQTVSGGLSITAAYGGLTILPSLGLPTGTSGQNINAGSAANRIYALLVTLPYGTNVSKMGAYVTTGVAASTTDFGLYGPITPSALPYTSLPLVVNTGPQSSATSSSAIKVAPTQGAGTNVAAGVYWLAWCVNSTSSVAFNGIAVGSAITGWTNSDSSHLTYLYLNSNSGSTTSCATGTAGTLPASVDFSQAVTAGGNNWPLVYLIP